MDGLRTDNAQDLVAERISEAVGGIVLATFSLMPEVVEHLEGVSYAYTNAGRDSSLIAEVRGKPGLKVGNELRLSVRLVDCLLFDGDGKRL